MSLETRRANAASCTKGSPIEREAERNKERYKDGEKKDETGDFCVFEELGAEPAQVVNDGDGTGMFAIEKNAAEQTEGVAIKVVSVTSQHRKDQRRYTAETAMFLEDAPLVVIETGHEDIRFGGECAQILCRLV